MNLQFTRSASDTKAEVEKLTAKLNEQLSALRTSEGYLDYLRMQAKFPHYSLNNCLLIMAQRPDAQHVAGYTVWSSLGRHVNAGEHGIRIMAPRIYKRPSADVSTSHGDSTDSQSSEYSTVDKGATQKKSPSTDSPSEKSDHDSNSRPSPTDSTVHPQQQIHLYFRPISVFDISQTSGDPLPTLSADELQGRVDGYAILQDSLMEASPVPVRFKTITNGAKGFYSPSANEIVIKPGMSEQQTLKTMAHEIGHAVAHSPDNPTARDKSRAAKETEAESIAYIVCNHYGIETDAYTFPYIGSWSSGMDDRQLAAQITGIKGSAVSIIDKTDACIQRHLSERRTEISYQIPTGYLSIQRESADGSIQYHLYDSSYQELKSSNLSLPPQISIQNAAEQVLINHGLDPQHKQEISAEQIPENIMRSRQNTVHHMH